MNLLHNYINIIVVFIGIIELHQILVPSQSSQYLYFSPYILYSNCCCHLPNIPTLIRTKTQLLIFITNNKEHRSESSHKTGI